MSFIHLIFFFFLFFKGAELLAKGASCFSVSGVYFTCPLTGATLTKSEREAHIKEAILMVCPKAQCCKRTFIADNLDAVVWVDNTWTVVPVSGLRRMLSRPLL